MNGIHGITLTALRQIADHRGAVLHMLRSDAPDFLGFGECYFSELLPNAVKAWKCHRQQSQTIAVPVGRIRIVVFDERPGSATKGRLEILELGRPDAYMRIRIPPGLWYGFACVGLTTALIVNCADHPHDPSESSSRLPTDPTIPYQW